jgi:outer membrane receptor for ferrienterochelin and colicin
MLKAGRSVAVVSVLLACSATLLATQTEASSLPDWQQLTLEEVEVVAQKAQLQSENLRVVNRISKEEIAKLPVVSVADLLDYLPGVDARTR